MHHAARRPFAARWLMALGLTISAATAVAQTPLFEYTGPPEFVDLPDAAVAAQAVRLNRRALQAPTVGIDLFGESVTAVRSRIERHRAGVLVWTGHLEGQPTDTVIVTLRGAAFSGLVQRGDAMYRIGAGRDGVSRLFELELAALPFDDAYDPPDGGAAPAAGEAALAGGIVQDLLVVYTQGACNAAGGCAQLEADITTAVADLNLAYADSLIDITMNLVGMALTDYSGTDASNTLSALAGTSDGQMDEVHALRDAIGADIVALVYDGQGCGIGYLPASASSAFSVTDFPCLVGNRTMAHEIGHNQGAHHDRQTVGGGANGAYNYGFRRCNDGSVDDFGSPHFRTVLAYSCSGSPRVGRFSNPNVQYLLEAQGVDPDLDPTRGAWNARTLNESASYVAGFRSAPVSTPPAAPSGLVAASAGPGAIDLDWTDNASDEDSFQLQSSPDNASWSIIATLAANTTSYRDDGLPPDTTRWYRVRASNSAGTSGWSGSASAKTDPAPPEVEDFADADLFGSGTVAGSFGDTRVDDGVAQAITETHDGGPKKSRRQAYSHGWSFDVFGGAGGVILTAKAWTSGSENADFFYSTDGGATWTPMFSFGSTAETHTFALPGSTTGPVRVEVRDADSVNGEPVDSVFVDYLVITSYTDAGTPPAAPGNLSVDEGGVTANSVPLSFTDNANDEFGFELWRANSAPGNCNAGSVVQTLPASEGTGPVAAVDDTAQPSTTYWYWAKAFNGAGDDGGCSNAASATTPAAPSTSLSVSAYKVKGVQHADLSWSGLGNSVDIRRDGAVIRTVSNGTAYTDNIGNKGGGSYLYTVCNAGSEATCTPGRTAVF